MAMDLDDGGVDHSVFHVRRVGAGLEKPCKNARLDPVAVALENSVPVAEERRKITPRASRPHDPKDSFHKATVVASAAPGVRRLTQTMRLHLRPLGVRQYESFHLKLESQPSLKWNPDSQQALVHRYPGTLDQRLELHRRARGRIDIELRQLVAQICIGERVPYRGVELLRHFGRQATG